MHESYVVYKYLLWCQYIVLLCIIFVNIGSTINCVLERRLESSLKNKGKKIDCFSKNLGH